MPDLILGAGQEAGITAHTLNIWVDIRHELVWFSPLLAHPVTLFTLFCLCQIEVPLKLRIRVQEEELWWVGP